MEGRLPWLVRDNPEYDPNLIGAITFAKVAAALAAAGKTVLSPMFRVRPYDLAIEEQGRFSRVQCKTGRLHRGAVYFRTHRLRAAKRETGWTRKATNYTGEVEFFGVYSPENDSVYLVPIADATERICGLRVTPARNNQKKNIRWAKQYLVTGLNLSTPVPKDLFSDL